jgi:hypothetical protein
MGTLAASRGYTFTNQPRSTVEHLVVVTHPQPITLEARPIAHETLPDGAIALGYYHEDHLVARGVVTAEAAEAINNLLLQPVSLALAAAEDDEGNIDARVCLVLPVDPDMLENDEDELPDEPWKGSLPSIPPGIETAAASEDKSQARLALLPIGNVVRGHKDRHHPDDVAADTREMLDNLVGGRARDSVQKAIDDLLGSL